MCSARVHIYVSFSAKRIICHKQNIPQHLNFPSIRIREKYLKKKKIINKIPGFQVKPHKCRDCEKTFPTPGDLRCHGYTHTGFWPFYCIICFKGFSKFNSFKQHILVHNKKLNSVYPTPSKC